MNLTQDISKFPVLAEGGEGIIYEYNNQIIKQYKSNVNISAKERVIKSFISKQLPKEIVKPLDAVYDRKGKFIGYLMDKITGEDFKKLSNRKFVTSNNISTKDILGMLIKIQEVLNVLHNQNIYVGDLNDQNILFDSNFNIYFIDCDSWSIDSEKCEVAMDLFKDPLLSSNNFNADTDTYAFSILAWKTLTRIHPFGGTMNPDVNILDRMKKGLSIIDNQNVAIPRTIKSWNNLSPDLINKFKDIFSNKCRKIENQLIDLFDNLKYCDIDKEYYYGKFLTCPLCDKNAKIVIKPISQGVASGLILIEVLDKKQIKTIINEYIYLDVNDYIVNIRTGKKVKYEYGNKYYFTNDDVLIEDKADKFIIHSNNNYEFEKKFKSPIYVNGNQVFFISKQNTFTSITVLSQGNSIKNICKCSNNVYFAVNDKAYCIVNFYDGKLIVNINGTNSEIKFNDKIINYGIILDKATDRWLVILENSSGKFITYILDKNTVLYETDKIKYNCQLGNVCFSYNTIFIPIDGKIRGFAYEKSAFKDFECSVVNDNSRLIRNGKKFTIINDENIYTLG